jgi:hypothetical protein
VMDRQQVPTLVLGFVAGSVVTYLVITKGSSRSRTPLYLPLNNSKDSRETALFAFAVQQLQSPKSQALAIPKTKSAPIISTIQELEEYAKTRIVDYRFKYFAYMAGEQTSQQNIKAAFDKLHIIPRVMRDVSNIQTSISLFGKTLAFPLLIGRCRWWRIQSPRYSQSCLYDSDFGLMYAGPLGFLKLVHEEGEEAVAKGAASRGVGFINSFVVSHTRSVSSTLFHYQVPLIDVCISSFAMLNLRLPFDG